MEPMESVLDLIVMEIYLFMKAPGSKINIMEKAPYFWYPCLKIKHHNSFAGLKEIGKMENSKEKAQ